MDTQFRKSSPGAKHSKGPLLILVAASLLILLQACVPQEKIPTQSTAAAVGTVHSAAEAAQVLQRSGSEKGFRNAMSELTEVYTATVGDYSYYRLQQNFKGIPVYGRTAVYVTDKEGNQVYISNNLEDVPENLPLTPSATEEQIRQGVTAHLYALSPEAGWVEPPPFTVDDELYIFDMRQPTRLVRQVYAADWCMLVDMHSGEVVHSWYTAATDTAYFASNNDTVPVPRLADGTYALKDERTNTYVYSANNNTYFQSGQSVNPSVLTLVTSQDDIFGNGADSVSFGSMLTAQRMLNHTNWLKEYFDALQPDIVDSLILIYDDQIGSYNGENGYASVGKAEWFLGVPLFDSTAADRDKLVGRIGIGSLYCRDPDQYVDILAHEYTHVVSRKLVGWVSPHDESGMLDEAYSDIFGELYEAYYFSRDPNWLHCVKMTDGEVEYVTRNLADPSGASVLDPKTGQPYSLRGGRTYPTTVWEDFDRTNPHIGSTIISHIAYKMFVGDPENPASAVDLEKLTEVWFRSMLLLTPVSDFQDFRLCLLEAADQAGLSIVQKQWICKAFDDAGIYYTVAPGTGFTVYGADGQPYENYDVTITQEVLVKHWFREAEMLTISAEPERNGATFRLTIPDGFCTIVLKNRADPNQKIRFVLEVATPTGDQIPPTFPYHTDFCIPPVSTEPSEPAKPTEPTESSGPSGTAQPSQPTDPSDATQPSQPTESPQISEKRPVYTEESGPVRYAIIRWDKSYRKKDGSSAENYYYDYVKLLDDSPAYQKINAALYAHAEAYLSRYDSGKELADCAYGDGYCTAGSRVTYCQNGIICVVVTADEYTGGNTNHISSRTFLFSLTTGGEPNLCELTGMPEDTLLPELRQIAWDGLQSQLGSSLFDGVENQIHQMQLEDFQYRLDSNGQILLYFAPYTVTAGAFGSVTVPTGLYLGGTPAGS